jgi:hypothetical protein
MRGDDIGGIVVHAAAGSWGNVVLAKFRYDESSWT